MLINDDEVFGLIKPKQIERKPLINTNEADKTTLTISVHGILNFSSDIFLRSQTGCRSPDDSKNAVLFTFLRVSIASNATIAL